MPSQPLARQPRGAGVSSARRAELLRIGRHDVIRWETQCGPGLTPLAPDPAQDDRLLAGIVFHMARCGSTLLAQLLAASRATCVLQEPSAVNLVLGQRDLTTDACRSLLRRVAATYRDDQPASTEAVVLKCTSWNVLHARGLLAAFPDTPAVFVVRDPLEVLVSLIERPPNWLVPVADSSREEQAASVVAGYLDAARHHADGRWLLVHHERLRGDATAVARHFGIGEPDAAGAAVIAARHSKRPDRLWRPDGAAKLARASTGLQRAHERHSRPAYERLLAAFPATVRP